MKDILEELRNARGQVLTNDPIISERPKSSLEIRKEAEREKKDQLYLNPRADQIDSFKAVDLLQCFLRMARNAGSNYQITNVIKETVVIKRVLELYSNIDTHAMFKFVFESPQNYIDKRKATPGLVYSLVNRVYPDMQDWIAGNYKPTVKLSKNPQVREWKKPVLQPRARIGEWGEDE